MRPRRQRVTGAARLGAAVVRRAGDLRGVEGDALALGTVQRVRQFGAYAVPVGAGVRCADGVNNGYCIGTRAAVLGEGDLFLPAFPLWPGFILPPDLRAL